MLMLAGRGIAQRLDPGEAGSTSRSDPTQPLDFTMRETSQQRGLQFVHDGANMPEGFPIAPWLRSLGVAVSVADVNHDGFMDIYVSSTHIGKPNALFINDGKGNFTDRIHDYGLGSLNDKSLSGRSIFLDCNGDGRRDLFQVRRDCPVVLTQGNDNQFTPVNQEWPHYTCAMTSAVGTADVNGDGKLDLIFGGYPTTPEGQRFLPANVVDGRNGWPITVMLGDGQCHFKEEPNVFDAEGKFFFLSLGIGDLRNSGKKDFWFATDYTDDKIFLADGGGYKKTPMTRANALSGMNSEVMYLDGDQAPYLFISQAYRKGYTVGGNNLKQWDGERFVDHARERGLRECGWSWGARAVDLNNDGLLDIAVANGFISGKPGGADYWFPFSTLIGSSEAVMSDWRFWPDMRGKSLSGFEKDCLYVNKGDHFENVADRVGFDVEKLDGRAVAVIDADNSGRQSLIIGNQNGSLRYYEIHPTEQNAWVGFELSGRSPNREAIGAKIKLVADGKTFTRENLLTNTFATKNDPRLHFGLGKTKKIESVEVQWPDGRVEVFRGLELNRYHKLEEGSAL
jgi:hypothetical protein